MLKLIHYYGIQLSQVSFQWVKMFQDYPLSKLIHVRASIYYVLFCKSKSHSLVVS